MKNISATLILTVCFSVYCYGQQSPPAISKENKTKAIYIPERTKDDLAVQRLQKREKDALELEKKNKALEYKAIDENQPVKSELIIMEKYKVSETPVKLEEPILINEYKPEVKEEQEQQLIKDKLQKPENKK